MDDQSVEDKCCATNEMFDEASSTCVPLADSCAVDKTCYETAAPISGK